MPFWILSPVRDELLSGHVTSKLGIFVFFLYCGPINGLCTCCWLFVALQYYVDLIYSCGCSFSVRAHFTKLGLQSKFCLVFSKFDLCWSFQVGVLIEEPISMLSLNSICRTIRTSVEGLVQAHTENLILNKKLSEQESTRFFQLNGILKQDENQVVEEAARPRNWGVGNSTAEQCTKLLLFPKAEPEI